VDLDRTAFTLDGAPITVGDVMAASWMGGWTRPLEARIREDLAKSAIAGERGVEISAGSLQDALDKWRLARDLEAAEDLDGWLEERGLTLDDLVEHLERVMLRRTRCGEADLSRCAPDAETVQDLLPSEAAFAGELERLAERFALRCVARLPEPGSPGAGDAAEGMSAEQRIRRELLSDRDADTTGDLGDACDALGVLPSRLDELLAIEVRFRIFQSDVLSLSRLRTAVTDFHDDLVRYEVATATCPTEDVAREIVCCVRIDGDAFPRSVARAGLTCRRDVAWLADLPGIPFGHRVPTTPRLGLLGPDVVAGKHLVGQVLERHDPDLSAPAVAERVRDRLLDRVLRSSVAERVRFPVSRAA
jgi:hypothetical protein